MADSTPLFVNTRAAQRDYDNGAISDGL